MKNKKIVVVIPAYNEKTMIGKVLASIPENIKGVGKIKVVVVDDGSNDGTGKIAYKKGADVLRHVINRGLGASLTTGLAYAKEIGADIVVTFDADGQHRASDISRLIEPIVRGKKDVVIGSRLKGKTTMPRVRKIVNWLSNIITFILFAVWTTDSQSGFRAFSKKAINNFKLQTQGMEVSSEIFKEVKRNKLTFAEVAIPAIYTQYSLSKGQRLTNASNVLWKLILRYIR